MAYTKAQMAAQIIERVEGRTSLDNTVIYFYVAKYIAAAINEVLTGQYWIGKKSDYPGMSGSFNATFSKVVVENDADRELRYINLPAQMINLPNDNGISYIGPQSGEMNAFIPIPQKTIMMAGETLKHSVRTFYLLEGTRAYFYNLAVGAKYVLVKMVATIDELDDAKPLPIPAGMETTVMDRCAQWFLGEREVPEDLVNDNVDNSNR